MPFRGIAPLPFTEKVDYGILFKYGKTALGISGCCLQ